MDKIILSSLDDNKSAADLAEFLHLAGIETLLQPTEDKHVRKKQTLAQHSREDREHLLQTIDKLRPPLADDDSGSTHRGVKEDGKKTSPVALDSAGYARAMSVMSGNDLVQLVAQIPWDLIETAVATLFIQESAKWLWRATLFPKSPAPSILNDGINFSEPGEDESLQHRAIPASEANSLQGLRSSQQLDIIDPNGRVLVSLRHHNASRDGRISILKYDGGGSSPTEYDYYPPG